MSFSSMLTRSLLLGGMALGVCSVSLGIAAPTETPHQHQSGLKQIKTPFSGSVSPSGAIEDNHTGTIIGEMDRKGIVYDNKGAVAGSVDAKGIVRNAAGKPVAQVAQNNRLAGVAFLLEK